MEENLPLVSFKNVSKRYVPDALVLKDICLDVSQGEFVSVIGPSGCGKTTFLKLIAGLIPVTHGELLVDGMQPKKARDEMAFVFQEPTLLPWLTVSKNIQMLLRLKGSPKGRLIEVTERLLDLVGLNNVSDYYPRQLSAGMKMRVSIARALSVSPKIILLDEPFAALDEMKREHLNEELLSLRDRESWTAFYVTHSVAEAVFLSTRVVVLSAQTQSIAGIIGIDFPVPRDADLRESLMFQSKVAEVSQLLRTHEPQRV